MDGSGYMVTSGVNLITIDNFGRVKLNGIEFKGKPDVFVAEETGCHNSQCSCKPANNHC